MRNHTQLEHEPKQAFENLQLLIVHEFAKFNDKVFEVPKINVILKQFNVPEKDEWAVDHRVWYNGYEVGDEVSFQVGFKYLSRLHFKITFEKIEDDINALDEANEDVVLIVIHKVLQLSRDECVVAHHQTRQVKVHEESQRDNQMKIPQSLIVRINKHSLIILKEFEFACLAHGHVFHEVILLIVLFLLHLLQFLLLQLLLLISHFYTFAQFIASHDFHQIVTKVFLPHLFKDKQSGNGPQLLARSVSRFRRLLRMIMLFRL